MSPECSVPTTKPPRGFYVWQYGDCDPHKCALVAVWSRLWMRVEVVDPKTIHPPHPSRGYGRLYWKPVLRRKAGTVIAMNAQCQGRNR